MDGQQNTPDLQGNKNNPIRDYADKLLSYLKPDLGGLSLDYSKSFFGESHGFRHTLTLRKPRDGLIARLFAGKKIAEIVYFDRPILGSGRHIYVYSEPYFPAVSKAVKTVNEETGLELRVRKYFKK